jgi:subtilisin family serine protease
MTHATAPQPETQPGKQTDWIGLVLVVLLYGWIHLISLTTHWVVWTVEQFTLIEGGDWPIWIWPVVALTHAVALLVPLAPLAWFWRGPRYRAAFQTWALAAAFALFLVPARFAPVNRAQLAAVLQIVGTGAYILLVVALIWLRQRRGGQGFIRPAGPHPPALMLAAVLAYAWLAWGALGSVVDTLLNLVAALLFGLAAGLSIGHFLLKPLRRTGAGPGWNTLLGGATVAGSLLTMSSAIGFNGLQLFLMLAVPALGWVLLALCHWGREHIESGWLALALLAGLAAAAPMLLVDPDELALVLNFESRDVWVWTFYATLVQMLGSWGISLPLLFLGRVLPGWRNRLLPAAGLVVVGLIGMLLYFVAGQPGLHGERLFVILKDQADVSEATTMADYAQRRQYVYDTLVAHANRTQADIRAPLDLLHVRYTPYYLVNAVEVKGGPLLRLWLSTRPEVDRILDSPVLRPLPAPIPQTEGTASAPTSPQWNLTSIGADRVWGEFGITGEGITVGQSDSGVQGDHPELKAAYRGKGSNHDYNWFDPWHHTTEPTDIGGHGTHTLGSILGENVGVAPGAEWYACANLARNLANPALYLDCMQFMLAPFPLDGDPLADGDPTRGAHVINNSWGCPDIEGCDPNALVDAVRALRAAGVFVVASAGNEGSTCGSVRDPIALYDESFSVGAVDRWGSIASFSSRGPVTADGSNRTKPDIMAPGSDVLSAYPGGTYSSASGTSMAGPHVVGVVALMWSANPALIGDIERTEQIIIETAQPYDYAQHGPPACGENKTYPNNAVGYGLVDAYAAVERALEENNQP